MAWTEAELLTQLESTANGRSIRLIRLIPGPMVSDVYAKGVHAPYHGRSRWVQLSTTKTAAQAAAQLKAGLLE